jgi:hypothetical protein
MAKWILSEYLRIYNYPLNNLVSNLPIVHYRSHDSNYLFLGFSTHSFDRQSVLLVNYPFLSAVGFVAEEFPCSQKPLF